jgi:hypothetical protein
VVQNLPARGRKTEKNKEITLVDFISLVVATVATRVA